METTDKEIIQIPVKKKRIRTKKYPEGSVQHRKDTNYNKTYYESTNGHTICNLCKTPILIRCLIRHQKTSRCLKYRICLDEAIIAL